MNPILDQNRMIPKIVHFIFGLAKDFGGKPFSFIHYMAIKSVRSCNPDYRIRFYCKYEPSGIYWQIAKHYIELVFIEPPIDIFGRPLMHVAHQADVIRLNCLIEQGGIYLDLDTITVQSFDSLLNHAVVMGVQGRGLKIDGLCNAVMLAAPNAPFMLRWLQTYKSFRSKGRDNFWDEHSVRVPLKLAREHPEELTILDRGAFFYPSAERQGLLDLFVEDKAFPNAYCHHLWEGMAWNLASKIDERNVQLVNTTYNRMARRFLESDLPEFEQLRAEAVRQITAADIRLNLGSGANKRSGWLNVDSQATAGPDMLFNLADAPWPLADESVIEVELSHILEHVGPSFETVIKEVYRVCKHGAVVKIKVPHPRHDWFLTDPTHNRALLPASFAMLDMERCKAGLLDGDTTSALAVYWNVDFQVTRTHCVPGIELKQLGMTRLLRSASYPFLRNWVKALLRPGANFEGEPVNSDQAKLRFLSRYFSNIVGEIQVDLQVRKGSPGKAGQVGSPGSMPVDVKDIQSA